MGGEWVGMGEMSGVSGARRAGLVMAVDAGGVGLLVVREAGPGILPRPCFCGLCKLRPPSRIPAAA